MIQHYTSVLKNYAVFEGRARRAEYWQFILVHIIVLIVLMLIDSQLGLLNFGITDVYAIGTLIPNIAVTIRRMHDVGKSGWFMLIPIYNFILSVTEGEQGSNQYGPDPKNPEMDVADHLVG